MPQDNEIDPYVAGGERYYQQHKAEMDQRMNSVINGEEIQQQQQLNKQAAKAAVTMYTASILHRMNVHTWTNIFRSLKR